MKLSLMLLNLTHSLFMGENFQLRTKVDVAEYEEILAMVSEAGYKAVDLADLELRYFGADRVKLLLDKYDLTCASVILFENYGTLDNTTQEEVRKHTREVIDGVQTLGCHTLMLVPMAFGTIQSREETQRGIVENLNSLIPYAKERGIQICGEDFPSTEVPMCSVQDMDYLFESIEGLKLVYDNGNMLIEGEDPMAYFHRYKDKIGYYHIKEVYFVDENQAMAYGGMVRPMGDRTRDGRYMIPSLHGKGILDIKGLFAAMKAENYNGYFSVEYAPGPEDEKDHKKNIIETRLLLEQLVEEA